MEVFPYKFPLRPNAVNLTDLDLKLSIAVIPAEAGIQVFQAFWTPAFAGVTLWAGELSLLIRAINRLHFVTLYVTRYA